MAMLDAIDHILGVMKIYRSFLETLITTKLMTGLSSIILDFSPHFIALLVFSSQFFLKFTFRSLKFFFGHQHHVS